MAQIRPDLPDNIYQGQTIHLIAGEDQLWLLLSEICEACGFSDSTYATREVAPEDKRDFTPRIFQVLNRDWANSAEENSARDFEAILGQKKFRVLRKSALLKLLQTSKKAKPKAFLSWLEKSGIAEMGVDARGLSLEEAETQWWDRRAVLQDRARELARIAQSKPGGFYDFMKPDSYKDPKVWAKHDEVLAELDAHIATRSPKSRLERFDIEKAGAEDLRLLYTSFDVQWAKDEGRKPRVMRPDQAEKLYKIETELREKADAEADAAPKDRADAIYRQCEVEVRRVVEAALRGQL